MKKPWAKFTKQGYISAFRSATPLEGVWFSSEPVPHDFQHTIDRIAKDGIVVHTLHSYCGQHRSAAIKLAVSTAKEAK